MFWKTYLSINFPSAKVQFFLKLTNFLSYFFQIIFYFIDFHLFILKNNLGNNSSGGFLENKIRKVACKKPIP